MPPIFPSAGFHELSIAPMLPFELPNVDVSSGCYPLLISQYNIYAYVYVYIYIHICIHTRMHIYIYICICFYVYIYIHIYIYILFFLKYMHGYTGSLYTIQYLDIWGVWQSALSTAHVKGQTTLWEFNEKTGDFEHQRRTLNYMGIVRYTFF